MTWGLARIHLDQLCNYTAYKGAEYLMLGAGEPRSASVVAVTMCDVYVLSRSALLAAVQNRHSLAEQPLPRSSATRGQQQTPAPDLAVGAGQHASGHATCHVELADRSATDAHQLRSQGSLGLSHPEYSQEVLVAGSGDHLGEVQDCRSQAHAAWGGSGRMSEWSPPPHGILHTLLGLHPDADLCEVSRHSEVGCSGNAVPDERMRLSDDFEDRL